MFPRTNPTITEAWIRLQEHHEQLQHKQMKTLFANDAQRFEKFSTRFEDILIDYSKNRITQQSMKLLVQLARESQLEEAIAAMFGGEKINATENRSVLHVALRNQSNKAVKV
ncbi:MAG: glucose-6-phosphate isomerase, partial [Bacteroidetes bacterium]|nr:glucose-6-phosphate isomerase [Bacteroidota bacterium]